MLQMGLTLKQMLHTHLEPGSTEDLYYQYSSQEQRHQPSD